MKRNIFIVMCMSTCILFTAQCGNDDRTDTVPPEIPGGIEELPGEDEDSPAEPTVLVDADEDIDASFGKLFENVKCPSPVKTGKVDSIAGKWKLLVERNGDDEIDRSCEEVVYHFKPDRTLTVSRDDETEEDMDYEYGWYPFCSRCLPSSVPHPNLKMGSSEVYCWVLYKTMVVYPPSDLEIEGWPPSLFFLRID
jgi:hypothetical protein